jgi:hypothetical protein
MVGRETIHFSEERSSVILTEPGATIAGATIAGTLKSIRVAENIAARETTNDAVQSQRE